MSLILRHLKQLIFHLGQVENLLFVGVPILENIKISLDLYGAPVSLASRLGLYPFNIDI